MSKHRASDLRLYGKRKAIWLKWHPVCDGCGRRPGPFGHDVHHIRGRIGRLLVDWRYWATVCRSCHFEIHGTPDKAPPWLKCAPGEWNKVDSTPIPEECP